MKIETLGGLTARITGGADGHGGGDGPVVVLLHGFGAPGDDLVGVGESVELGGAVRWVFPEAPLSLEGMYGDARAWWIVDFELIARALRTEDLSLLTDRVPEGLLEARAQVQAMLEDVERKLRVAPERVVLGGFSQGAMLSLDVALTGDRAFAGLVLLSGSLIAAETWRPRMRARSGLPVFQSHGRRDEILPYAIAELLRDELSAAGLQVEWTDFLGGHEIPGKVLTQLSAFLRRVTAL